MNVLNQHPRTGTAVGNLPLPGRIDVRQELVDGLASMLLQSEEILALLEPPEANAFRWIETHVRRAYDEVNNVLLALVD